MTTAAIRKRLHDYINIADDKIVEAIYSIVKREIIENNDLWEEEYFLNDQDRRMEELESGKVEGVTIEELKSKF